MYIQSFFGHFLGKHFSYITRSCKKSIFHNWKSTMRFRKGGGKSNWRGQRILVFKYPSRHKVKSISDNLKKISTFLKSHTIIDLFHQAGNIIYKKKSNQIRLLWVLSLLQPPKPNLRTEEQYYSLK